MIVFKETNVNPKNRDTEDCSTRALVSFLNISYDEALDLQCSYAKKYCYGLTGRNLIKKIVESKGCIKLNMPKNADGSRVKVKDLDSFIKKNYPNANEILEKGILISVANHWTVVKGKYLIDTWNCGSKACGSLWVYPY